MTVLVWLVACLVGISAGLVLMLVILRVTADLRAKRRAHAHAVTRELVLTVLMGEPDEVQRARDRLAQNAKFLTAHRQQELKTIPATDSRSSASRCWWAT